LKNFIETGITYIGLLGPTARKDELLRSLEEPPPEFTGRIYGPVGLNLGGELPEEIALSLIAEIQAVFNKRPGSHLSGNPIADSGRVDSGDLSVIVLAAGGSSRFGALKQLLEYKGKSFLKRAVETSLALKAKEVLVIHGPKATKCQREVSGYEVSNIVNYEWEAGMSSSLVLGIRSISSESKAVLVLLCDQPLIGQAQLEQLISLWRNNPDRIVASEYGGTTGVPAIIPAAYFEEMKKLAGDTGAKKIIATHADTVLTMAVPEAEIDIDTENDFSELLRKKQA
jgi:molybdenum cofactor cytidylyltransferase